MLIGFGKAARATSDRAAAFANGQQAYQTAAIEDRVKMLATQLDAGIGLDLKASSGRDWSASLGDVATAIAARTGLQLVVGSALEATGVRKALGEKTLTDVTNLLGAADLELRGVFGSLPDPAGALKRLERAAQQDGLLGLIASAGVTLSKMTDPEAAKTLAAGLTSLTKETGSLLKGAFDFKGALDFKHISSTLDGLATAVQNVGALINADPGTIQTITKVVRTIGAVAQGAQMGASFGPIGAVVGGAIGLITSLFGGEPARDPTLEALTAIDAKLVRIHTDMIAGFKALSDEIRRGFEAVNSSLVDLRNAVTSLQQRMIAEFEDVKKRLRAVARDPLVQQAAAIEIAASEHELAYRKHMVDTSSNRVEDTASNLRIRTQELMAMLESPGAGFANAAVTGTGSLSAAIANRLVNPAGAYEPHALLALERRFLGRGRSAINVGGPTPLAPKLYPDNKLPPLPRLSQWGGTKPFGAPAKPTLAEDVCTALRDKQYIHSDSTLGAPVVHELHVLLLEHLKGLESTSEWKLMSREQRAWLPSPLGVGARIQPVVPEDLSLVAATIGAALEKLTDPRASKDLLGLTLSRIHARVANHQLLTDPSMAIPLLVARRNSAHRLALLCAEVFCNRAMTAARVMRASVSSILSKGVPVSPDHARLVTGKDSALALYDVSAMPLRRYNSMSLGLAPKPLSIALDEMTPLFTAASLDQDQRNRLSQVAGSRGNELAQIFADDWGQTPSPPLLDRLTEIVWTGTLLATIESAIEARLAVLENTNGQATSMRRYTDGFEEFVLIAAHAISSAQNQPDGEVGLTAERILVFGHLAPPALRVDVVEGDPLPAGSNPYPVEIGCLWGWGAEDFALADPISDDLFRALSDPACALAGSNYAIQRAAAVCMALESAEVEIELASTAAQRLDANALTAALRKSLGT